MSKEIILVSCYKFWKAYSCFLLFIRRLSAGVCLVFFIVNSAELSAQETSEVVSEDSSIYVAKDYSTWGAIDPGKGFNVAKTKTGSLNISAYAVVRYINQFPARQDYFDHLGRERNVFTRNDIHFHRVLLNFQGFIYDPKFNYVITAWTVNTTQQIALVGALSYAFDKKLNLFIGIGGLPGTRSLQGSHPYWLAPDRVMADEYFRPGFTNGAWISGEALPKFYYKLMVGNNLSQLGITAGQLTRDMAYAGSLWWMPTTGEFGPRGGFGDHEYHEKLATRIGTSLTYSREDRFNQISEPSPDNTQIRISDALLLFEADALQPGVTIQKADFKLAAFDAGIKYKGLFLQAEYYLRGLDNFKTDSLLTVKSVFDHGFYVQAAFFPIKKKLELYSATSWVFGEFNDSYEILGGMNFYPSNTRNLRVNLHFIRVYNSPVSSVFGYYTGGLDGGVFSFATSVLF